MNKLFKTISLILVLMFALSAVSMSAFAQGADKSPNIPSAPSTNNPPATSSNAAVPADVKPVKTYAVTTGTMYTLPADVKQTGDSYASSNTAMLTVDKATGGFKGITSGTAYIVVTNGSNKRYIKITVGTGKTAASSTTQTQNSSVLTGYSVTVNNKTTLATSCNFTMVNGVERCLFLSSNGTTVGSISSDDYLKIAQTGINNGTLPKESADQARWFANEFNKYRGLSQSTSSSGSGSTGSTGSNTNSTTDKSLGTLINEQRRKDGIDELTYDSDMQALADTRAKELATKFSHERPDGTYPSYAEIITRSSTSNSAFNNFNKSEAHRNIMLSEKYTGYAVGQYTAQNGYVYWVVLFSK